MRDIKRLLLLVFAFLHLGYLNGYSQVCPAGDLTTNPYICGTYGDANGVINWDWEVDPNIDYNKNCLSWQARTQQGNTLTGMGSPFYNSQTIALDLISQAKDYTRARGWELLQRNFGCDRETPYPYFILYNKYTGLMRVFIYQPGSVAPFSSVLLTMEPLKAPYPATTSLEDAQVTAPDKYYSSTSTTSFGRKLISVTENSGSGNWRVAEFNMGFDPEINASNYLGTGFKISINGIINSNVKAKIRGRSVNGTDPNIYNYSYATNTDPDPSPDGNSKKFKATGEKFIKFSKTLNESRDGVFKAANNIVNSLADVAYGQGMKGRIKGVAYSLREIASSSSSFGKVLGQLGSALGAAGQVLNLVGGVIGLFGGGDNEPAAMPTYTSYDMELDGTITTTVVPYTFIVRMPGALQPDNNNATYYKCPLGIFNIKNTPQADKVTYERNMGAQLHVEKANFVSYRMRNNLEVAYNSGAGLEFVSAEAAIVGEVMADADMNAVYDLLADHISGFRYNLMLPDLQAGLLEITTYDTEKKLHSFQTPYVNLECLNGLAFNARAETNVFLRVRAILKKKNDPDNIPIYFIRDYKIDTQEGEFDEELRNRHKSFYARSTPTPYSNYGELPVWVEDQLINNHHYTGYTEEKVDSKITAEDNVLVTAGAEVVFKAGYEVELNPGFEADYGSDFEATLKISQVNRTCGTPVIQAYEYSGNCYNTAIHASRTTTEQNSSGNANASIEEIKVYPVPTNGKLVITGIANNNNNAIVTILDQSGRTIREVRSAAAESAGQINLDLSALSNGVYFIKIQTLTQTITRKIVVSK
jgi:hypothetical protein